MGKTLSKIFGKKDVRVLMLGLDACGKTSILYRLKLGSSIKSIPTVGFNVETVKYKNVSLSVWDVGGQSKIRPLWRHYYTGSQALIYVVDASDRDRIDEARTELHRIINDREMREAVILIYLLDALNIRDKISGKLEHRSTAGHCSKGNKQDLPNAMKPQELQDKLGLTRLRDRNWYVQPSCATSGEGLHEGLSWLTANCPP